MPRRSPLWSDPRVKPPFGSVEVDWGHPLAPSGACFIANEGAGRLTDLVSGSRTLRTFGAGSGWAITQDGVGFYSNDDAMEVLDPWSRIPTGSPFSIAIRLRKTIAQGDDYYLLIGNISTANYVIARSTVGGLWYLHCDGTTITGGTVVLGELTTLVSTVSPAGTLNMYKDGALIAGPTAGNLLNANASKILYVNGTEYSRSANGLHVSWAYVYRRELSASDAREITITPYAGLRPVLRRRYFVPAAAPADQLPYQPWTQRGPILAH